MVDLDPDALYGKGLSATDVSSALNLQNLILPTGTVKVGTREYLIRLNSSPALVSAMNDMPIKTVNGAPVYMRDVAQVRDGYQVQTNIVHIDGSLASLLTVLRHGGASTLSVVQGVKDLLPKIQATLPPALSVTRLFDQSLFVKAAVFGVVREASIAALLTALMILLFLGSWRSTLIVCISIPLSILTSLAVLALLGQTINIMTLGGLALAVGILVDDAAVAIENTYRLMGEAHPFRQSVVEGAAGIAKPALISTLAICAAFVSVLFLTDTPKFLFTPQALAVVFAMLTSYLLSRTVVPILIDVLVKKEYDRRFGEHHGRHDEAAQRRPGFFARFHAGFERWFARFHAGYLGLLRIVIGHRIATLAVVGVVFAIAAVLFTFVGQDYFPQIDAGELTLHVRTRPGKRIESAEQTFAAVEDTIRKVIKPNDLGLILDNIGLPASNYNFAFGDGSFVSNYDGQILISLKEGHAPTNSYRKTLRKVLRETYPDT